MHTTPEHETLFTAFVAELVRRRRMPIATYRLQFNAAFTFEQARQLVPYLHALGISDCYASPYLKARPGSTHGYDTIDFQALNPEIGTESDYAAFVQTLQQHGMGQLLDIVPNHMGVLACRNAWWQDVLAHGPASIYAPFFDIDWQPPKATLQNKVLLPILGDAYGTVLENQELQLSYASGGFECHYYEHQLPIAPCTTTALLRPCVDALQSHLGENHQQTRDLQDILRTLDDLPSYAEQDPHGRAERYRQTITIRQRLVALYDTSQAFRQALTDAIETINGVKGVPHSFDGLHTLLEAQAYRLSFWRTASDEINYRRFFDINDLAALRQEKPAVFEATHKLILDFLEAGMVTGVRIDHPDGLFDPDDYFRTLQRAYVQRCRQRFLADESEVNDTPGLRGALMTHFEAAASQQPRALSSRPLYVVVEKILEADEQLPETWPVDGTTGYDFLNQLNGLFVDSHNAAALREFYADFVGTPDTLADTLYATKKQIMQTAMASELAALGVQLDCLSETHRHWRDFTRPGLTEALQEIIACFPVYRTYIRSDQDTVRASDRAVIEVAVTAAQQRNPAMNAAVFAFVHDVLLLQYPEDSTEAERQQQLQFVRKFQQVTGPVMAKGLEDTAFYRYTPLVSLNEVGGNPDHFGISAQAFHRQNLMRRTHWPGSLLATSTHDTKRSEDVRARLNVLSEIPQQWRDAVWHWHRLNQPHKTEVDGRLVPSRQEEYLLYQTLLGTYPLAPLNSQGLTHFCGRIQAYMGKALREAKVNTSWHNPHNAYEAAVNEFVRVLLDETRSGPFLEHFRKMQQQVADAGIWNALAQTLLKLTSPGVPDVYQGCEVWDFSLVDPDNRRPVDYTFRHQLLSELQRRCRTSNADRLGLVRELLHARHDGRIKLYVTWQALTFRHDWKPVFLEGDYRPLEVEGSKQRHVCAFARAHGDDVVIVLVPRLVAGLLEPGHNMPLGQAVWGDTRVVVPDTLAGTAYRQVFTGKTVYSERVNGQIALHLAEVLTDFPVSILQPVDDSIRGAQHSPD